MTEKPAHTPTPWSIEQTSIVSELYRIAYCIGGPDAGSSMPLSECVANAEFIVRAVNSHEALVEACRKVESVLRNRDQFSWFPIEVRLQIQDAIKKAEDRP